MLKTSQGDVIRTSNYRNKGNPWANDAWKKNAVGKKNLAESRTKQKGRRGDLLREKE